MRQLVIIVMLFAFFAQTFSKTFVVVEYYTNMAAFAKNCVNKARPQMHCNGKCQFMKKLQQQEESDKQNIEHRLGYNNDVVSSSSCYTALSPIAVTASPAFCVRNDNRLADIAGTFFHPPGA